MLLYRALLDDVDRTPNEENMSGFISSVFKMCACVRFGMPAHNGNQPTSVLAVIVVVPALMAAVDVFKAM